MTDPAPVRFFVPDTPQFMRNLKAKLREEFQTRDHAIASGVAGDYADYRHRVGELRGLEIAFNLCEEAEKEMGR